MKFIKLILSQYFLIFGIILRITIHFPKVMGDFKDIQSRFFSDNAINQMYELGEEMYEKSPENKKIFQQIIKATSQSFDANGYKWIMNQVSNPKTSKRFTQALDHPRFDKPHCDRGNWVDPVSVFGSMIKFPGGAFQGSGFDLSTWMGNMYKTVQTPASVNEPASANMALQIFNQLKGILQTIIAIIVDTVPPLVIGNPLPCLPMLTGINCIGSVLYPIAASDFVVADVIDSSMNGVISSFPSKYAAKVGRTDDTRYKICASVYLGMYWLVKVYSSLLAHQYSQCVLLEQVILVLHMIFSSSGSDLPNMVRSNNNTDFSFTQCLAVLVACPGFWMDDIAGACGSNVSAPPLCSFSAFVNIPRIPPQLTTYEASKLYPDTCPKYDSNLDLPLDIYSGKDGFHSSIEDAAKEKLAQMPFYERLIKSLEFHYAPKAKPCDCEKMKVKCKLHLPYPVHIKGSETVSETHFERPEMVSDDEKRCCAECKPIWAAMYSVG